MGYHSSGNGKSVSGSGWPLFSSNIPLTRITSQTVLNFQSDVEGIKRQNWFIGNLQSCISQKLKNTKKYTQNCQIIFNRYNNQHFFWIKHSVITFDLKEKKKKRRRISHRHIPVKRKKKNRPLCFYYNVKRWKGIIIHDPIKEFCPVFFCGTRKVQQSLYRFSFALFSNKTSQLSINRNVVHCFSSLVLVIRF